MDFKSKIRLFITYIIIFILVTFGVVTVFSTDLIFEPKITNIDSLSKNIFLDDKKIQSNYIIFESSNDLSKYNLASHCNVITKFLGEKNDEYAFKITYLDKCNNPFIYLETKEKLILNNSTTKLNIFNKSTLFELYSDMNDLNLEKIISLLDKNISELNIKKLKKISDLDLLQIERKILEFDYQKDLLKNIYSSRKLKYTVPILGYSISNKKNEIPNAGRPYRNSYTDGIHHGWDVIAPNNTNVIALDDSKVIRIVKGFVFSDLSKIKKTGNITIQEKHNNLDILRGNQVWLKTSKGDVVFYSHLSTVSENIKVGDLVSRGEYLGKTGITGVPDKNYKNYHLHFSIMKNPYIKSKVGKYSFNDYLNWNWYFKGKSLDYVIENQKNIFN